MNIFKFKPTLRQCPHTMTAQSPARVVLAEYQCDLPVNHDSMHRSKEGVVWDNMAQREDSIAMKRK